MRNGASGSAVASVNNASSAGLTRSISDMITPGLQMKLWIRRGVVALVLLAGVSLYALQQGGRGGRRGDQEDDVVLPNGKAQKDEILKAEHQQNLKDAAELADLAEQLKIDLEKNDRYVLSMATLKKTDDIEKLAKRIRARLHH
jgi:hypothetical protein